MTTTQNQPDREEMTLRAAGAISALLADHLAHPWRDCIELVADNFTEGRWKAAQTLAWDALTTYIDRRVVWSGPKGARLIRLPVKRRTRTLEVA